NSLPSFAPKIISSIPSNEDTVDINTTLKFLFSKSINLNSFENGFSILPDVPISNIEYVEDQKTILVSFQNNLNYDSDYSIKIDSSVTDLNETQLDGNGDGTEGDSFTLSFHTIEQDITGPNIVFKFPNGQSGFDSVDVESVISIEFNELVDPSTINHNNIIFKEDENVIGKDLRLTTFKNQSILNIKTSNSLKTNTQYSLNFTKGIKDINGNGLLNEESLQFITSPFEYNVKNMVDDFTANGFWEAPGYSGSTTGIVDSGTTFDYTNNFYLPASSPARSAFLQYQWDLNAPKKLIREYLSNGAPRNIIFDTSYVLQVYIYGDASNNRFRFAIDEGNGTAWPDHEVSNWVHINWTGWRLVEWNLSDPSSVGTWIGNEILDGAAYRIDSFQMTDDLNSEKYGRIYFDNLRVVKKSKVLVGITDNSSELPNNFALFQNYPNPFNPSTNIQYAVGSPANGIDRQFVSLKVYDILGREIATLVNKEQAPGTYEVNFDASKLASGQYIYTLKAGDKHLSKVMLLLK
ncbi:MAG: Ig-like domain-containing protein, partial [Ignavibacteriaceae bacterium]